MPIKTILRLVACSILFIFLSACVSRTNWAPVESLKWSSQDSCPAIHQVQRGDTLYTLAFKYEQDFQKLAKLNKLQPPYVLHAGQRIKIRLRSEKKSIQGFKKGYLKTKTQLPQLSIIERQRQDKKPHLKTLKKIDLISEREQILSKKGKWYWPAKGKLIGEFSPIQGKKGIDIAGKKGDKIYAASEGVIAYAGSGLGSYGNLIIIKHNNQFLTAYANNLRNLVSEGEKVKAGQVIANMGIISRQFWGVHFEIRRLGKPVNPLIYLNRNKE